MSDSRPIDRSLAAFFLIAFAWTWSIAGLMIVAPGWVDRTIGPIGPGNPLFFIAVYGPSIAAILVTAFTRGGAGVRALLAGLVRWRFNPVYYLSVLIGVPLLAIMAGHLGERLMGTPSAPHIAAIPGWIKVLPIALLLDPGPLGEELGWRGFALPRMVKRWGAPLASGMLGLIWGVWHYPAFRIPGMPQGALNFPLFVAATIVLSVLVAWLVLRTGGSVLIAVLFHLAVNTSLGAFQPPFAMFVLVLATAAAAILLFDRRFRTREAPDEQSA
jgi:membrane protease YdiL (CAAX protease family)